MSKAKSEYRFQVRHWREKWDPDEELIFTRRMKLGLDPKNPYVSPGDPVTKLHRERLGIRKLLLWWHSKHVGLKKWAIKIPQPVSKSSDPIEEEESIFALGGGWYRITFPDGTFTKAQGLSRAKAMLEE